MDIFLQQIINGVTLGSVYALVALGYTMVYGILGLINFAHGDVMMIGAMVTYSACSALKALFPELGGAWLLLSGIAAAIPVCMAVSYGMERMAYRPLRNAPKLAPLITAIGISVILQTAAMLIWGRNYQVFPNTLSSDPITLLSFSPLADETEPRTVTATHVQLCIVAGACALMCLLTLLINHTGLGRAMRATAENPKVANLMGIDHNRVIALTFMLGAALAAVAGAMVAANYSVAHFYMGFIPGLKAFTAAVLGGIGNLYGAMLGGLVLGIVESLGAGYISEITGGFFGSNYQDVFAFVVLITVLTLRPSGLLGERVAERS
ncbi:MAG: branched-chain amino acid ABC transporter permease [Burkholderiales bacterium]|jgi:branched-chain amino acid transport system permease protein|nr:branched-chain amino acid ABC transporter permease [Burkholderiales bacterium]